MPRGPGPGWRARKPPVLDDWLMTSVQRAGGPGKHHPETGHYGELVIACADVTEARNYSQALYRCARYLSKWRIADIGVSVDRPKKRADGTWGITFRAVDKTLARNHVMEKYGPDKSKWPYDPTRKGALY
jgi:hypothetical protein